MANEQMKCKEGKLSHIIDPNESNHLERVSIPCDHCYKTFLPRMILRLHKSKFQINDTSMTTVNVRNIQFLHVKWTWNILILFLCDSFINSNYFVFNIHAQQCFYILNQDPKEEFNYFIQMIDFSVS